MANKLNASESWQRVLASALRQPLESLWIRSHTAYQATRGQVERGRELEANEPPETIDTYTDRRPLAGETRSPATLQISLAAIS